MWGERELADSQITSTPLWTLDTGHWTQDTAAAAPSHRSTGDRTLVVVEPHKAYTIPYQPTSTQHHYVDVDVLIQYTSIPSLAVNPIPPHPNPNPYSLSPPSPGNMASTSYPTGVPPRRSQTTHPSDAPQHQQRPRRRRVLEYD